MSAWEWLATLVMVAVASGVAGAVAWHRLSASNREADLTSERSAGYYDGLQEGLDKGFRQAQEAQRRKDSARAHKAWVTRHRTLGAE